LVGARTSKMPGAMPAVTTNSTTQAIYAARSWFFARIARG